MGYTAPPTPKHTPLCDCGPGKHVSLVSYVINPALSHGWVGGALAAQDVQIIMPYLKIGRSI